MSPLYARAASRATDRPAGLTMGYASLTGDQIVQGVRTLAAVIAKLGLDKNAR
ncbi:hypothetical protein FQZ97_1230080 [compost metagenome]